MPLSGARGGRDGTSPAGGAYRQRDPATARIATPAITTVSLRPGNAPMRERIGFNIALRYRGACPRASPGSARTADDQSRSDFSRDGPGRPRERPRRRPSLPPDRRRCSGCGGGGAPGRERGGLSGDPLAGIRPLGATPMRRASWAAWPQTTSQTSSAPRRMACLHELDRFEDDGHGAEPIRGAMASRSRWATAGWTIDSSSGQALGIGEDEAAQGGAIERAVGTAVLPAESGQDGFGDRGAGRHHVARQPIRVDDGGAAFGSQPATVDLPQPIGPIRPMTGARVPSDPRRDSSARPRAADAPSRRRSSISSHASSQPSVPRSRPPDRRHTTQLQELP